MPITSQQPRRQLIPHLPQADQSGLPGLRIAPPSQPIAQGIRIGDDRSAQQPQAPGFAGPLAQVLQALAPGLEHQNRPIHEHRRRIPAVAARTGQIPIQQSTDAEPVVALGQQG